jgi:LysR family nitrogen assimilation transcriptional regulator
MDIKKVQVFLAVAQAGSISKAAKNLRIAQPAISRTISQLEYETKNPLFFRRSGGVELTEVGKTLCEYALKINENVRTCIHN